MRGLRGAGRSVPSDSGAKALFDKLHKLSVFITISLMVMTGVVLARFV